MTLKQRARTGLEAGPSTVTEFQHPAGSPECRQAIGRRDVHSPAQCRHACSSERPTSGVTDKSATPEWMPNSRVSKISPFNLMTGYEGALLLL